MHSRIATIGYLVKSELNYSSGLFTKLIAGASAVLLLALFLARFTPYFENEPLLAATLVLCSSLVVSITQNSLFEKRYRERRSPMFALNNIKPVDIQSTYRLFESVLDFAYLIPLLVLLPLIYEISFFQGFIVILNAYFFFSMTGNIFRISRLYRSKPTIQKAFQFIMGGSIAFIIFSHTNNLDPETMLSILHSSTKWIWFAVISGLIAVLELVIVRYFKEPNSI